MIGQGRSLVRQVPVKPLLRRGAGLAPRSSGYRRPRGSRGSGPEASTSRNSDRSTSTRSPPRHRSNASAIDDTGDTEWAGTGNSTRTIKHGKLHRPRQTRACQQRNALNPNPSLQVTAPEVNNAGTLPYPAEIIAHCVWLYHRFPLSFREVEELMVVRGVIVTYETIRQWCAKFGPDYAAGLRRRQPRPGDTWHLDEVFLTITGRRHYLWRAVDRDGNVLDILV